MHREGSVSRARRRHAAIGALALVALAVTMSPWWIRNYLVTGRFVATSLQAGASLYDGLSPHATGASDMRHVDDFARRFRESLPPEQRTSSELEYDLDRRLHDAAVSWAREHPGAALRLAVVKFVRMWSPWPHAAEFQSWPLRLAVILSDGPLLILGLWGAWRFVRRDWPCALCLLPAIYFTGLHVAFVASMRYRQPAMLALIVLAAGLITQAWSLRSKRGLQNAN